MFRIHFATACGLFVLSAPSLGDNDECTGAELIGDGLVSGSNSGATTSATTGSCEGMESDVWYRFEAANTGTVTASFCAPGADADFDTVLAAFDGSCGSLVEILCNDDTCDLLSEVDFPVAAGGIYYLAVGGYGGDEGSFVLSLEGAGPSANDECSDALVIGDGPTSGSNVGATTSATTGSCGPMGSDVWYTFQPESDGFVTAGFCALGAEATFDTVLAAFEGSCGSLTELACNDDACGSDSEIGFPVVAGMTYYLAVGGYEGDQGTFTLVVDGVGCSGAAVEIQRAGIPANPMALQPGVTSGPVIGQTWDPVVDHSSFMPSAIADLLLITLEPTNIHLQPIGTLLVLPPFAEIYVADAGEPFEVDIPDSCDLVGIAAYAQAGSGDGVSVQLTNALDIVIGVE